MPASWEALNRRSPEISWYLVADNLRTVNGWMIPNVRMLSASSFSAKGSKVRRGWSGLASIAEIGSSATRPAMSTAGVEAAT